MLKVRRESVAFPEKSQSSLTDMWQKIVDINRDYLSSWNLLVSPGSVQHAIALQWQGLCQSSARCWHIDRYKGKSRITFRFDHLWLIASPRSIRTSSRSELSRLYHSNLRFPFNVYIVRTQGLLLIQIIIMANRFLTDTIRLRSDCNFWKLN